MQARARHFRPTRCRVRSGVFHSRVPHTELSSFAALQKRDRPRYPAAGSVRPVESPSPSWLSIPARGLFTGACIVGAVGSGKTSACMHPFARQLLGWRADDPRRRAAALVLEVKGDFCFAVRGMLETAGRADDYRELSLAGEWSWNPLNEPEIDSYSLAYSVGSLLNQLFGKGKEPFWQQAYTNLVRFTIELHQLEEQPWFTLQDVYRLAIAGDRFLARIEEAGQRIPAEWAAGADAEAAPVERACIAAEDLAARLGELARWEWARVRRGLRFEAVQRWFLDDWAQLDQKLRTSIVEGISSFLSLFDEPGVAAAFCPPRPDPSKPAARRLLPSMEELIESGGVLAPRPRNGAGPGPAPRPLPRPCGSCNAASAASPPASPAPASAAPPAAATPSRPVPATPPTPVAPRRSAATRRGSPRSGGSTPCSAAPADSATAPATRNTRWWRPPATGTCGRFDTDPDSLLRIRTPLPGRIGLLSEPGRCL